MHRPEDDSICASVSQRGTVFPEQSGLCLRQALLNDRDGRRVFHDSQQERSTSPVIVPETKIETTHSSKTRTTSTALVNILIIMGGAHPSHFNLCTHTSPPTPYLKDPPRLWRTTDRLPGRCQPCDILYRRSSEKMILELYNGKIRDQKARLLIAKERRGTDREGRYDAEMVEEGARRIKEWQKKRDGETFKVWEDVSSRWHLTRIARDTEARDDQEGRMRVWIDNVEQA